MSANDVLAIEQLLARYAHRVDRGSADEVAALFAPNAKLIPRYDGDYELVGRAEVERWYAFYHANFRAGVRHLKHMIMSAEIDVSGDTGKGCSYLLASAVSEESGAGFLVTGTYNDTYIRHNDDWLINTRIIDVEWMTSASDIVEQFPPLNFPVKG